MKCCDEEDVEEGKFCDEEDVEVVEEDLLIRNQDLSKLGCGIQQIYNDRGKGIIFKNSQEIALVCKEETVLTLRKIVKSLGSGV